jgi:putative aminopeptidase FrvX
LLANIENALIIFNIIKTIIKEVFKVEKDILNLLEKFDNTIGVTGYEGQVVKALTEEMAGLYDEHYEDKLGNNIFVKRGTGKFKLMLCAHMDEIGFIVSFIDENGYVRIVPAGYHDDRMAVDQDLVINTFKGNVYGVTGSKPAHVLSEEEKKTTIPISELFIDVGTNSREETENLGVRQGDPVGFNRTGYLMNEGKVYTGKSVDNRAGCAVMVEVMKMLSNTKVVPDIYAVGTIQEELGMRGAGPAAHRIDPDMVLAIDVTLAGDTPGIEERELPIKLGKGAAIKMYEWDPNCMCGNSVPMKVTSKFIEVAEKNKIPYQRDVLMYGGTDGWSASLSGNGYLTGIISVPERYMHTAVGAVNIFDMECTARLIVEFIKDMK